MRKLSFVALAAVLVSCASSKPEDSVPLPDSPPLAEGSVTDAAPVPAEEPGLSSDPFANPDGKGASSDANLATKPSDSPATPAAPAAKTAEAPPAPPAAPSDLPKPQVDASDNVASTMGSNPVPPPPAPEAPSSLNGSSASNSGSGSAPSEAQAATQATHADPLQPVPPPTVSDSGFGTPAVPGPASPTIAAPGPGAGERNVREEYQEYKDQQRTRATVQNDAEIRTQFPHEAGEWQLGLDFAYHAYQDLDFDTGAGVAQPTTNGGVLSFGYYPLHDIDTGRLGISARGGAYWSNFQTTTGGITSDNHKLSLISYGGRATYEFDYWIAQLLVPFVYVGYEQVQVKGFSNAAVNYAKRTFGSTNYGAGLNFNLNRLEPSAASKGLSSTGIRKVYLSYTYQQRSDVENTGSSHYLGLKFEF